ncbi:MAG: hypothetical protein ACTSUE_00970 [Promethearchaeota archaeon]
MENGRDGGPGGSTGMAGATVMISGNENGFLLAASIQIIQYWCVRSANELTTYFRWYGDYLTP